MSLSQRLPNLPRDAGDSLTLLYSHHDVIYILCMQKVLWTWMKALW